MSGSIFVCQVICNVFREIKIWFSMWSGAWDSVCEDDILVTLRLLLTWNNIAEHQGMKPRAGDADPEMDSNVPPFSQYPKLFVKKESSMGFSGIPKVILYVFWGNLPSILQYISFHHKLMIQLLSLDAVCACPCSQDYQEKLAFKGWILEMNKSFINLLEENY